MSKLLSLDQSSRITGYAIFNNGALESYGKFDAECAGADMADRLSYIRNKIKTLIIENEVSEVVFEDIQLQANRGNNVQTFKVLAEVYGVISQLLQEMAIPQTAVLASSWKSTLGIKGKDRAEQKRNAQQWVINTYSVKPTQDECDAICIGQHHLKQAPKALEGYNWAE